MDPIVRFNNISKKYYLGSKRSYMRYLAPKNVQKWYERVQAQKGKNHRDQDILWALQDVSFDVNKGETVGLIGPNGAGKTTTLALLAGITAPTQGKICIRGRVSALIQLGAGFHPELTGLENIYLNGTIMGMKKRQIDKVLDEIIAFSELEQYINTPIKRYSSGMYVRLGFAVAAHLDPEILLVDEVLAVGDASFKAKCYKKLRGLRETGTTVVLVSHDLSQIKNLCSRAILLKGKVLSTGSVDEVVDEYYRLILRRNDDARMINPEVEQPPAIERPDYPAWITSLDIFNGKKSTSEFKTGESLRIVISYRTSEVIQNPAFGVSIQSVDTTTIIGTNTKVDNFQIDQIEGEGCMEFTLPHLPLLPGSYFVSATLHDQYMGAYDRKIRTKGFHVISGPTTSGIVLPPHEWSFISKDEGEQIPEVLLE